jgi:hypothetical protein
MRKGPAAVFLLACVLAAAGSSAAAPAAVPTPAPRFTAAPALDGNVLDPEIEPVALTSRDRATVSAREPQRWDVVPTVADDAAGVLEQLVMAERAVRDPATSGAKLAFMGHLQQLIYRRLIERADLRDTVFDGIPKDLRRAADLNIAAGSDLWPYGQVVVRELPDWHIASAPPIDDLLFYYREAEVKFDVPWYYLAAINLVETRMGRIRGDSYAGAQGPMQFMPATWDMYGDGDINDTHDAILAAGRYLSAAGAPEKIEKAIWMYNHDNEYVAAVMEYAEVMRTDPSAFRGYYGWQVYFVTVDGTYLLPEGWSKS